MKILGGQIIHCNKRFWDQITKDFESTQTGISFRFQVKSYIRFTQVSRNCSGRYYLLDSNEKQFTIDTRKWETYPTHHVIKFQ